MLWKVQLFGRVLRKESVLGGPQSCRIPRSGKVLEIMALHFKCLCFVAKASNIKRKFFNESFMFWGLCINKVARHRIFNPPRQLFINGHPPHPILLYFNDKISLMYEPQNFLTQSIPEWVCRNKIRLNHKKFAYFCIIWFAGISEFFARLTFRIVSAFTNSFERKRPSFNYSGGRMGKLGFVAPPSWFSNVINL